MWLQLQCSKSGEVDLLQVQHGNGTAIIKWRWLADPQAGVRGAATMGNRKASAGRYGSRQVVYGEEMTQEGSQGWSSEVVLAMVKKNEETDCQRLLSGESQASNGHWLFRL
jgi:hypothetical protein